MRSVRSQKSKLCSNAMRSDHGAPSERDRETQTQVCNRQGRDRRAAVPPLSRGKEVTLPLERTAYVDTPDFRLHNAAPSASPVRTATTSTFARARVASPEILPPLSAGVVEPKATGKPTCAGSSQSARDLVRPQWSARAAPAPFRRSGNCPEYSARPADALGRSRWPRASALLMAFDVGLRLRRAGIDVDRRCDSADFIRARCGVPRRRRRRFRQALRY